MRARIAVTVFATTFGLMLALSGSALAKNSSDDDPKARSASVLRAEAAALRDQANHLRDGDDVKKPNVPRAKELERKADALERRANKMNPQDWPPN